MREFEELCLKYHLDERIKFDYTSDFSYPVSAGSLIDVDNTTTVGRTLTQNWLMNIYRDRRVDRVSDKINALVEKIHTDPSNANEYLDKIFLGILKKVPLRESTHVDALLDATLDTAPPPKTGEFLMDLRDRGITRGMISYTIQDLLERWYDYKIAIPGTYLRGIRLKFKDGILDGYNAGGKHGKVTFAENYLRSLGFRPDDVFAVDDDPIVDRSMILMLGIKFVIWVDEDEKRRSLAARGLYRYPGEPALILPEAKGNMRLLIPPIDKWGRARLVGKTKSPDWVLRINRLSRGMSEIIERYERDRKRKEVKRFISLCEELFDIGHPVVSTILSGIDDLFIDLRTMFYSRVESEDLSDKMRAIHSTIYDSNPEPQLPEEYQEKLKALS